MRSFVINIKTQDLLPYREFDRIANPAPKTYFSRYTVEEVQDWIVSLKGKIPPLEFSIHQEEKKALLTDGNHRIAAASLLGLELVPVRVIFYSYLEICEFFYPQTIAKFKPISENILQTLKQLQIV